MKYETQVMVGVLFTAFFLTVTLLPVTNKDRKMFESYCEQTDSLCIYRNGNGGR